ncbi:hypothetical protein QFZ37_001600 [Chryseobacterium ginsenosidimutans]|uniref:hypothetical protein n=1 Tax=Chryseobacterium ginsenosidimutans TaxID=687846 RepID=UPI0027895CBB|nr:hypothetical protein [Chryseobacterium ginsenosidimutans]MDQ0593231.1 hypothetical protein [Chryseobacterium ginsenosidimutans]
MKKLLLPFCVFILSVFNSCSNESSMSEEMEKSVAQSYDVYIAGRENSKACYWKNNVKTDLTGGDNLVPLEIKAENNNVYVTGSNGPTPTSFKSIHYFWKNGIKSEIKQYLGIPSTAQNDITGFAVNNGDIYFAGYVENLSPATPAQRYELCYWKNGVKTLLYQSQYSPSAEGVFINGADVYVSALIVDSNQNTDRGYFKNTVFNSLGNPNYVFNFAKNTSGLHILFQKNAKYYSKNISANTETLIGDYSLSLPFYGKIASDENSNDLYTTYYNQGNEYFKNNSIINTSFSSLSYIQDLFVLNNNVYMIKYSTPTNSYTGKVFINGVETQNINGTQNGTINYTSTFNAIYVVEN